MEHITRRIVMTRYLLLLIASLCAALLFSVRSCRKAEGHDRVTTNAAIDRLADHIREAAALDAVIEAGKLKSASDSIRYARAQDSLKTEINGLHRVVKKYLTTDLRRQVAALTPDSAETAVFVRYDSGLVYRDSMIETQTSLISELYADKKQTWENFNAQITGLEGKVRLTETYSKALEQDLSNQEKSFRRLRRRERIVEAMIIAGIIAVAL